MRNKVQNNDYAILKKFLYETLAEETDKLVEQYTERHQIPPVDLFVLIQEIGNNNIELKEDNTSIYDGYSKISYDNKEKFIIFYKNAYPRKFFTIAHELAHYYILKSPEFQKKISSMQIDVSKDAFKQSIERACNVFAANLLLPRKYLISFTKNLNEDFSYKSLRMVCNNFRVSEETLIRRLNETKTLEMPNLLVIFKRTPYFDPRNPRKMKRNIKWRVWHRATPQQIFIPRNIPAEKLGFSINTLNFGMKKTIKRREENINLKIFDKKWMEKEFKVFSQYTNKDDNTIIALIKIMENKSVL